VREGFGREGLGDLAGQVVLDSPEDGEQGEETIELRDKFKKFAGKIYLPKFVIQQGSQWREVSYETDIVSRIDWRRRILRQSGIYNWRTRIHKMQKFS